MLHLHAVGPKFTAAVAIDQYLLQARARTQQQTRRPPLVLSIDGTDRRTEGHSTSFMTLTAYYVCGLLDVSPTELFPDICLMN